MLGCFAGLLRNPSCLKPLHLCAQQVGVSAGGWLARLALSNLPYDGEGGHRSSTSSLGRAGCLTCCLTVTQGSASAPPVIHTPASAALLNGSCSVSGCSCNLLPSAGQVFGLCPAVHTLLTCGTPHQSLESYPFGRAEVGSTVLDG